MNHVIGTASYFLAEKKLGFEKTLTGDLTEMLGDKKNRLFSES
jgi:hypothetical protein